MKNVKTQCFVCKKKQYANNFSINQVVHLPVCDICKGSDKERQTEEAYLDSLADDFVCGCI